jgi:uncharacterized membrane protein
MKRDGSFVIRALWSRTFKRPMNDEHVMRLTPFEALEHVLAQQALNERESESFERKMGSATHPKTEVKRDADAARLADSPHLTGDPEWDEVELAETAPDKPPLTMKV